MNVDPLRNLARDRATVEGCELAGLDPAGPRADHDYRLEQRPTRPGHSETYAVCVWCRAVRCGHVDQPDPCIEPWHHEPRPHRTAAGVTWPIGGNRPGTGA